MRRTGALWPGRPGRCSQGWHARPRAANARHVDEGALRAHPRERLDAQGTRSGEQVQHLGLLDRTQRGECVEGRLAYPVGGGPHRVAGRGNQSATPSCARQSTPADQPTRAAGGRVGSDELGAKATVMAAPSRQDGNVLGIGDHDPYVLAAVDRRGGVVPELDLALLRPAGVTGAERGVPQVGLVRSASTTSCGAQVGPNTISPVPSCRSIALMTGRPSRRGRLDLRPRDVITSRPPESTDSPSSGTSGHGDLHEAATHVHAHPDRGLLTRGDTPSPSSAMSSAAPSRRRGRCSRRCGRGSDVGGPGAVGLERLVARRQLGDTTTSATSRPPAAPGRHRRRARV